MSQQCWATGGNQTVLALTVGVLGTAVLCVGLPAAIVMVVRRRRDSLDDPRFLRHFASLISDYKPNYAWWEAVNLVLMAMLVAVGTFGKIMGGYLNLLSLAAAQLLSVTVQALWRPQRVRQLHWVQTTAYCGVLLVGGVRGIARRNHQAERCVFS
jgi:hypothetical protein